MAPITSIIVTLRTDDRSTASTDDPVYLGVVGRGGGGEFALLAEKYDDHEAGSEVIYRIGGGPIPPIANPRGLPVIAVPLDVSDLAEHEIGFRQVDYVYLRKYGHSRPGEDDAWIMGSVKVELYQGETAKRTFQKEGAVQLSTESGLQVWIPEVWSSMDSSPAGR